MFTDIIYKSQYHARHCVKSVQIRSFFWSVFSRIWTEYGPEKTPYLDTFHRERYSKSKPGKKKKIDQIITFYLANDSEAEAYMGPFLPHI